MYHKCLDNPRVWASIAMFCPILLLVILVIVAPSIPNFDPFRSLISSLSLGEFGWLGATVFAFLAVALSAFARALSSVIVLNKQTRTSLTLLYSAAICLLLLIFVDIEPVHPVWTIKRFVHWAIASAAIACFNLSGFYIVKNLKNNASWKGVLRFTIIMAVITVAIGTGMAITTLSGLTGLLERLILASGVVWVEVMSFRIYRLSRSKFTDN